MHGGIVGMDGERGRPYRLSLTGEARRDVDLQELQIRLEIPAHVGAAAAKAKDRP